MCVSCIKNGRLGMLKAIRFHMILSQTLDAAYEVGRFGVCRTGFVLMLVCFSFVMSTFIPCRRRRLALNHCVLEACCL